MKDLIREMQSYPGLAAKMLVHKRQIKPTKVNLGEGRSVYFLHYTPELKKHSEVVLYIHGGGWNSKEPRDFDFIGQKIAQGGSFKHHHEDYSLQRYGCSQDFRC